MYKAPINNALNNSTSTENQSIYSKSNTHNASELTEDICFT